MHVTCGSAESAQRVLDLTGSTLGGRQIRTTKRENRLCGDDIIDFISDRMEAEERVQGLTCISQNLPSLTWGTIAEVRETEVVEKRDYQRRGHSRTPPQSPRQGGSSQWDAGNVNRSQSWEDRSQSSRTDNQGKGKGAWSGKGGKGRAEGKGKGKGGEKGKGSLSPNDVCGDCWYAGKDCGHHRNACRVMPTNVFRQWTPTPTIQGPKPSIIPTVKAATSSSGPVTPAEIPHSSK